MRELEDILAQYETLKSDETGCVLATVVHVEGSSYRRAGARMLVDAFGNITGAISGGCLEGDALRKALNALNQQKNKLVTYDTNNEDDAVIGAQLGCNGIIQVLFEPLDYEDEENPCELLKKATELNEVLAIVVRFNLNKKELQSGTSMLINEDQQVIGSVPEAVLNDLIEEKAHEVLLQKHSQFMETSINGKKEHLFIQYFQPPVKLILVGAGNDAQILAQQAELLGWTVIVADGRPTHATEHRFANCQVIVARPEETLDNIDVDERTCIVLMSHNYNYDLAVFKLLKDLHQIPYIGILGPFKKYNRMLEEIKNEVIELSTKFLDKIHAPVGLEIGAETPAEIGLSILAEIQSVLTNTLAKPLKEKEGPIHDKRIEKFKEVKI
ncbi:XdhC family protein [Mangrovivirga cuniculi]|uniref:XdhC/CoxI type molybdenum-dependent oxidoreductase accessory protein n=1 Tax=Mangrovivirga cuniculi TaxID=2715131 RepID=A0A4D7JHA7_9BACT|nr:XdhC/CoxI family protein [Mangrovivirga cuniculi]QCK15459.1 XdhC/CoxI type molybdenum-dependent oxidoreductase accessory protein [Mangrovivirga cuniculi]